MSIYCPSLYFDLFVNIFQLLLQDENVGIEYEYSVPNERAPPKNKQYNWVHEEFTPCSAPCGGGLYLSNHYYPSFYSESDNNLNVVQ